MREGIAAQSRPLLPAKSGVLARCAGEAIRKRVTEKILDERRTVFEAHFFPHFRRMLCGEVFKAGVAKRVGHVRDSLEIENNLVMLAQLRLHFAETEAVAYVAVGEEGAKQVEHSECAAHKNNLSGVFPPVKPSAARQIRAIRTRLGFMQSQFAALLNVPKVTGISWENGTRKPSGAALRLLAVAKHHPEALQAA